MSTTIRLNWNPNPSSQLVTSYQVLAAKDGGPFNVIGTSPSPSFDFVDPAPGQYDFALKAVNFVGVSPLGAGTSGPSIPSAPSAPVLTVIIS